jgi:multiple sugar transport system permease protein
MPIQDKKIPLPLQIIALIYLVAGIFCAIVGAQLGYNTIFVFHTFRLLFVVFIFISILFLLAFRGFMRLERWARGFGMFSAIALILFLLYHYKPSRLVPFAVITLFAAAMIVYLKQYQTTRLFITTTPISLQKTSRYILLIVFGISMIMPFYWLLSSSLKTQGETLRYPPRMVPTKNIINIAGKEYDVSVQSSKMEILHLAGAKKDHVEFVDSDALQLKRVNGWILPWQFKKLGYTLRENIEKGRAEAVPVEIRKNITTVMILKGPRKFEELDLDKSQVITRLNLRWTNYPEAYKAIKIGLLYWNSIKIAVLITLGQVFTSSLAAYAFARLQFPGRDKLFLVYLGTMMVPAAVTMIPLYTIINKLNLMDTHMAVILPAMFSAYGTFMLRQFYMSIPKDLEEAAKIDGCSLFGIYWRVIIPLSKPALATLATFTFMGAWRNFMWPLVVLNSSDKMTLPVGLQSFMGIYETKWNLTMAGTTMAIVPLILIFIFNQRFFVKGIQLGAIKG